MKNIKIEKAKAKHINYIYSNIKACADDMAKQGMLHWIPYYEKKCIEEDIKSKDVYIVKIDNNIVGNFILTVEDEKIYLGKLAILPEYSDKGIGTKCLEFIEKYAQEKAVKLINIDVYEKSINAINFYKKNGYKIIGEKSTRRFRVKLMQKELR